MAAVKSGDRVQIATRDVTADDEKSGLYYTYFGGLTGTVDRVYDDGTVCVDIDLESLSQDTRERHLKMQDSERQRWMDSLSGEVRGRLTPEQKQLRISYKLLVRGKDLGPFKGEPGGGEKKTASRKAPAEKPAQSAAPEPEVEEAQDSSAAARRASAADLEAQEEAHLREIQGKIQ